MTEEAAKKTDGDWRPQGNPWLIAVAVTLAAFMEVLDTTIVNVALPHIAGTLSVSYDQATWALTSYLVANSIVLPISGFFARVIGRKRYFVICIFAFTACSFLCGIATSLPQLIVFRVLQGFFGGGLQPNQQSIILDTFPPAQRGRAFSLTAIATVVAPVLGPTLGGWITDSFSWRWVFFINVPVGLLTAFAVMSLVEDPPWLKKQSGKVSIDYIGISLIILTFASFQILLDRGEDADWFSSNFIRTFAVLAAVGCAAAVGWLLYTPKPVVDIRLLKDRNFALGCAAIAIFATVLYGSAVLIPQLAQQHLGYTATLAGLVLSPGALTIILLIPLVSLVSPYVQTRYVLGLGFCLMGCGLLYSRTIAPDIDFWHLVLIRAAQAFPLAFLFVPASVLAYQTVPQKLQADAAALFTMFRNVAGSVGISLSTALIVSRTQTHMAYLSTHLSQSDANFRSTLEQYINAIRGIGTAANDATMTAMGLIYQHLIAQAGLLAYMDVFLYCALMSFAFVPFTFLFSSVKKTSGAGSSLMRKVRVLAPLCLACGLVACKVGPNFKAPNEAVPDQYAGAAAERQGKSTPQATSGGASGSFWWQQFHDPELDRLEERIAAGNLDLKAAFLRIVEARIQVQLARAQGLPSLKGTASYNREQLGLAGIIKSQHIDTMGGSATAGLISGFETPVNLYTLGFDASWELDLFGKVRRSVEAADAKSQSAVESRNDLLVSLEAEVAQTYFQLRAGQALHRITADQIAAQRDVTDLTRNRYEHGLAGEVEVDTTRAQMTSLQSQLPPYDQSIETSRHALAVLMGQTPDSLANEFGDGGELPPFPAVIPVGLPSTLARRRPDIRASEAALHAATAQVGVAVASLFPDISLTGTLGLRNLSPGYLFNWDSKFYTFGPTVSVPLFQGGALVGNVRLSRAQVAESALNYRKTVLNALQEVEDGLTALHQDALRTALLRDTVSADQLALEVDTNSYRHGLVTYITVLTVQIQMVQAQQQLAGALLTQSTDLVKLYKALGGGWEDTPAADPENWVAPPP